MRLLNRLRAWREGKPRAWRRGLVLLRGLSIATPGFDPESRVFIFRHFLATQSQLKTLDSGCCRSGSGGATGDSCYIAAAISAAKSPSASTPACRTTPNGQPQTLKAEERQMKLQYLGDSKDAFKWASQKSA